MVIVSHLMCRCLSLPQCQYRVISTVKRFWNNKIEIDIWIGWRTTTIFFPLPLSPSLYFTNRIKKIWSFISIVCKFRNRNLLLLLLLPFLHCISGSLLSNVVDISRLLSQSFNGKNEIYTRTQMRPYRTLYTVYIHRVSDRVWEGKKKDRKQLASIKIPCNFFCSLSLSILLYSLVVVVKD